LATASIAMTCGTPTPVTMRVVQIEPGPMPTLTASAPASMTARAPSAVATLPTMTCVFGASKTAGVFAMLTLGVLVTTTPRALFGRLS
jgi:hypothetical protein